MIHEILQVAQIIIAGILIGLILIQTQGAGLSSVFGGGGDSYHTKRGIERFVLYATAFTAAAFLLLALIRPIV